MARQTKAKAGDSRAQVAKKAASGTVRRRKAAERHPATQGGKRICTPEERHRMICEQAYFLAERRGFQEGAALDDWLEAEAIVDAVNISRAVMEGRGNDT